MCPLDKWIKTLPKKDQSSVGKTTLELWDLFDDLEQKGYLRPTLQSKQRKDFPEILKTSDGLTDAFNMLFAIPSVRGEFVGGRNKEFVEHNLEYRFTEKRYIHLLLSESMSVFLRNVELFRSCFLFVLKTKKRLKKKKRTQRKEFYHTMGIGELLNNLVSICGKKGEKIKKKIDVELRNGLTHGLVWIDGLKIRYARDITFSKIGEIRFDTFWINAREQSKITQCLIHAIIAWYSGDC